MVLLNASSRRDVSGEIIGVLGVGQDITEIDRLRTESETVAKELTQFIERANAPIFGIDKEGKVNEWNETSERITGFTKKDTFGKNLVEEFITDDYKKQVKEVLNKALDGDETANFEFPLFTKKGERVMVLLNASSRRDASGDIVGMLGVGQDITEIDKFRTEADRTAVELTQFIERANAPIFGIDKEGKVNEWNETSERITGFTKKDTFGKNLVEEFITDDYKKQVKEVLNKALDGDETANFEFPLFTKKGERVMVLLNASSRRDASGDIVGMLGVGQDITEIDKFRTEADAIAKELTQFIETANAPIIGIDNIGNVNEWNQTAERITGFSKKDTFGKNLVEKFITNEYKQQVNEVLDKALIGEETANFEFPLFTKKGERVMVLLNASSRRDMKGQIVGAVGVGQDITELSGYRENLEKKVAERTNELNEALSKEKELNELKTRFVSMASHEFRTPLSSINFASGFLRRYYERLSKENFMEKVNKIEKQVAHMSYLLDDVLLIGKSEEKKIDCQPIELNFKKYLGDIIEEVDGFSKQSHEIKMHWEGERETICIDEKLGKNIFSNLLTNAIKFSPDQDSIEISINTTDETTIIKVKDFGIGIEPSEREKIFEPFHRAENVGVISGTGLGLSIVKKALDLHHGKLELISEIGEGTQFSVTIPKLIEHK